MKHGTILAAGALVAAGVVFGRQGPLDPPPGPATPTMRTLDEIYDLVELARTPVWEYHHQTVPSSGYVRVLNGSGVLHGVIGRGHSSMRLRDGTGRVIGLFYEDTFTLDVRFENGLDIDPGERPSTLTILYRPDPQ